MCEGMPGRARGLVGCPVLFHCSQHQLYHLCDAVLCAVDRTALVSSGTEPLLDADFMRGVLQHYSVQHLSQQQQQEAAGMQLVAPRFPLKHLNIVDPLLPSNNLGRSVSKASYARVKKALALGNRMLEEALLKVRLDGSHGTLSPQAT